MSQRRNANLFIMTEITNNVCMGTIYVNYKSHITSPNDCIYEDNKTALTAVYFEANLAF